MTFTLTLFYECMEIDYHRFMTIVNSGPYQSHPDLIKVHHSMCAIFKKSQSLENLAAAWSFDKLLTEGLEVDRLSKSVEALIIRADISHPIHKGMAKLLIKYAKLFQEGHVASTSEMIQLRFPSKKKEAMDSIIRINQLLIAASELEDIEGIAEALMLDQTEVGEGEKESHKEIASHFEQEMDEDTVELVNPLELNKCFHAFQDILNQVDFFMYKWFFYDEPTIWIKENCQRFSEQLKNPFFEKIEDISLKRVKNNILKEALISFSPTALEQDGVLATIWQGKSPSLFQKYWTGVKEKQEACRKVAMANYFSKTYDILDHYEESIRQAYHSYLHKMHAQDLFSKKQDRVKKNLSHVLRRLFTSNPDGEMEKLELEWKIFLEKCRGLYEQHSKNIATESQAVLVFLKKLGLDEVKKPSSLEQDFLILHHRLDRYFLIACNQISKSATYHPLYSEEIKTKPVDASPSLAIGTLGTARRPSPTKWQEINFLSYYSTDLVGDDLCVVPCYTI